MKQKRTIGFVRADGMTGLLRKKDMNNALKLKVARGSLTFPRAKKVSLFQLRKRR